MLHNGKIGYITKKLVM